jgi:LysM repeat protein
MPVATYLSQVCNKTTTPVDVVDNSEMDKDIMVEKSGVKANISESAKDGTILDKPLKVTKNTLASSEEPLQKKITSENQVCNHIYRNADTGLYYNRDTGKLAEGECGGITYKEGLMQNSDYQSTTATTEMVMNIPQKGEFTSKGDESAGSHEEAMVEMTSTQGEETEIKIEKVEPKIIYKPAAPITIDPSIEPQDTKIIIAENTLNNTISVDCSAAPRTGYHLVKKGETLYKLSNLYNVSIQEIMQWNGLSNSEISVCAQLRVQPQVSLTQSSTSIPANEFVSKGGATTSTVIGSPTVKRQYHYIAQGETLYAISRKYDVSVAQLKDLNKLKDNYLKPGWRLLIPNSSDQIGTQPMDTKKSPIILEAKPSTDYTPKSGSSMKIPDSSEDLLNNYQNQHIYHTVGQNETIEDIALKYGASINSIKLLNEMSEGEVLIPFQKIKVR